MSVFTRGDVRIAYEVHGEGFPVLAIAPGGMRSHRGAWSRSPWDPVARLGDAFRVVTMDQRNAGESFAPVSADDGWDAYAADQLALLDHLGVGRFAVVGMCIGGAYIANLLRLAPERVAAAVMLQPIGHAGNRQTFFDLFDGWAAEIGPRHPEADEASLAAFRERMFGGDFLFSAGREVVAGARAPLLVLMGDDVYHPQAVSREVAALAPEGALVERWKEGADLEAAAARVRAFLEAHAAAAVSP